MASIGLDALQAGQLMNYLRTKLVVCILGLVALTGPVSHASSVFDGTNANLWLIDADQGRVTGYSFNQWLEQFAPGNVPEFPLVGKQQALINNLQNSSLPMTANQPAVSIAGIGGALDSNNPNGHAKLLVLPESGNYGETVAVLMSVDTALMELDRPTLNWTVDGGTQQSILLSKDLLQRTGAPVSNGYYTTIVNIARDGVHTVDVTLTEPNAVPGPPRTIASEPRTYTIAATHIDGEKRDTDGDGIPDVIEVEIGLDPFSDDWLKDADGDGWSEFDAWLRSTCLDPETKLVVPASACLDPDGRPVDTDGDGWSDFDEILRRTNHLDPEPTLPAQSAAASAAMLAASALAPTDVDSVNFCTDGSTFYFNVAFYAEADDAQLFDIIFGIGSTAEAFIGTESNQRIRVNFDESGSVSRGVNPEVQESIVGGIVPPDRWQVGLIQDFTIESTSQWNWLVHGSVPVGTEPFAPGDTVRQLGLRANVSGNRYIDNIAISGNPADCSTVLPPPPPPVNSEPTGLDYKDFPAARRLYEVEKIITGNFTGLATEVLPAQNIEAVTVLGQTTYSTKDLLTVEDIEAVSLLPQDVAARLQASHATTAIANRNLPVMRLPVAESNVVLVEHRDVAVADYSRFYKLWISKLADISPRDMFDQPGQPVYASADEWRDAFVAFLEANLAIDVAAVQVDIASTRVVSLVEGVLSQESRFNNAQKTQIFATDFGSVDEDFVLTTIDSVRRYGGENYTLDNVAAQLDALSQTGQPLQPVGDWIDTQFMTFEPGTRSDALIVRRTQQSYDSDCFIESSVVVELQADADAWAAFIARCPNYVTEVDVPAILLADQARQHQLRLGFLPGSAAPLAADATLLEPGVDSDTDNRINTIEVARPLPDTTLPWDPDTDGDLILDGDDPCTADPYNQCSRNPILPGLAIGADIIVSEPTDGSGVVIITIILDRVSDEAVTVDYRAYVNTGDTAADGSDFTAIIGSVTIAAGDRVAIITVPIHADAEIEGGETFTVEITGITGATGTDDGEVIITLTDPPPSVNSDPVFTSATTTDAVEGRTDTGYVATASDDDNDTLAFSTSGGADQAAFSIDSVSGVLSFVNAPDFNAPTDADADNTYEVQLTVDDGNTGTATLDLAVTVVEGGLIYVEVTYPTENANVGGFVTTTTVTGNVVDPSGAPIDPAQIASIDVNGSLAVLDAGDPSRWSAQVPLIEGLFTLPVNFRRSDGSTQVLLPIVENNLVHTAFGDIEFDAVNDRVLVLDTYVDAILAVHPLSGFRSTVTVNFEGPAPNFGCPTGFTLDMPNDRALVTDQCSDALFAVDLTTGARSYISRAALSVGAGPTMPQPWDVALDAANNRALVVCGHRYGPGL